MTLWEEQTEGGRDTTREREGERGWERVGDSGDSEGERWWETGREREGEERRRERESSNEAGK